MSTWKERLAKETNELKDRRDKLNEFVYSEALNNLPTEDQDILVEQLAAMNVYYDILKKRCALHKIDLNEKTVTRFSYSRALELLAEGRAVSSVRWGTEGKVYVRLDKTVVEYYEDIPMNFLYLYDTLRNKIVTFVPSTENQFDDEWYEVTLDD